MPYLVGKVKFKPSLLWFFVWAITKQYMGVSSVEVSRQPAGYVLHERTSNWELLVGWLWVFISSSMVSWLLSIWSDGELRLKSYRSTVYNHEFHWIAIRFTVYHTWSLKPMHHEYATHLTFRQSKTFLSFNPWQTSLVSSTSHWLQLLLGGVFASQDMTPKNGQVRKKALILWVSLWPSTSVGSERWGFPWCEKPNRGENTPRNFSQQTPLNNKAGPQKET